MDYNHNRLYRRNKKLFQKIVFWGVLSLFSLFCLFLGTGLGLIISFHGDLPSLAPLEDYNSEEWNLPTKIYDRKGTVIATFYEEKRELVDISELPPELIEAVIAIEDNRFFQHQGIDFQGIARAAVKNIAAGRIVEGGSTITQQLAKVLFLNPRQTFKRKMREALLALEIERTYTKKEILERYFNKIYFGAGAYGVESASQVYFGKSAREINTVEAAMLAGLPQAPSLYSPLRNPELTKRRHRTVLNMMAKQGFIQKENINRMHREFWEEFESRQHKKLEQQKTDVRAAGYFVEDIRIKLIKKYGRDMLYRGGLEVHTTLNMDYQKLLEEKMYDYLLEFNIDHGNLPDTAEEIPRQPEKELVEGAAILRHPQSGEILAVVGGHRWHTGNQFNRATQSRRQPGSAFKPVLYAAALDNGYTPASKIQDRPLYFNTPQGRWVPSNYSRRYYGEVTLREALINSLNVASVALMNELGTKKVIRYARKLGINTPLTEHMSLALGGLKHGINLEELTRVYSVFANQGILTSSIYIKEVRDREGNLLERNFPFRREVISPQIAYLVTSLLEGVVEEGTGRRVGRAVNRLIAGKTGTTNQYRDAWFIGYTPRLVFGSWFGYDINSRSLGQGMSGGVVAGDFWHETLNSIFRDIPRRNFSVPEGITYTNIDLETGYLATPRCPNTKRIPFLTGTEPTERCPKH
jgi:penicillin-binding protein 1A